MPPKEKVSRAKSKKRAVRSVEHVIQIPLMDGCFLSLQINKMSGVTWTLGFPKDKIAYPISQEVADTLSSMAGNRVPAGWAHRELSDEEVQVLKERAGRVCQACQASKSDPSAAQRSVQQFVTDMGEIWNAKHDEIMETVNHINALIVASRVPIMDAIFSLLITALTGATTVGAGGHHIASLVLQIAEHVKMTVENVTPQMTPVN